MPSRDGGVVIVLMKEITFSGMPDLREVKLLWPKVFRSTNFTLVVGVAHRRRLNSTANALSSIDDYAGCSRSSARLLITRNK